MSGEEVYPLDFIDPGSGPNGGDYTLSGVIGQPDAGSLSGGNYVLQGGFLTGGTTATVEYKIFLPLVMKNWPPP